MVRHARQFPRRSEQPRHIVNLMGSIEQNSAAQFAARRVTLAVVLPRPPVRQITSGLHMRPKNFALPHVPPPVLSTSVSPDGSAGCIPPEPQPRVSPLPSSQFLHSIHSIGKRLLDENMCACLQCLHRLGHVTCRRTADQNRICWKLIQPHLDGWKTFDLKLFRNVLQPLGMRIAGCQLDSAPVSSGSQCAVAQSSRHPQLRRILFRSWPRILISRSSRSLSSPPRSHLPRPRHSCHETSAG